MGRDSKLPTNGSSDRLAPSHNQGTGTVAAALGIEKLGSGWRDLARIVKLLGCRNPRGGAECSIRCPDLSQSQREILNPRPTSALTTVLVFLSLGLLCGIVGAAALWWFATQPFEIYTASYHPLDSTTVRADSPSPLGFMATAVIGGGAVGALIGALVHYAGWGLTRRSS